MTTDLSGLFESIGEFGVDIDDFLGTPPVLTTFSPRTFTGGQTISTDFMGYVGFDRLDVAIYVSPVDGRHDVSAAAPTVGPIAAGSGPCRCATARSPGPGARPRRAGRREPR